MTPFILTPELITRVLSVVDKGLVRGIGKPRPGHMCVEAAVCYAMDLPHGDEPTCVHPAVRSLKITLNDSLWSSNTARAEGMRRLAVLQLGTKDCNFDAVYFTSSVSLMVVNKTLLPMLRRVGLDKHADACAEATTLSAARDAARDAASYAASYAVSAASAASVESAASAASYAASYAASHAASAASYAASHAASAASYAASYAASHAARAARAASYAASHAARDAVLKTFATEVENILINMNVPAVKYLSLID